MTLQNHEPTTAGSDEKRLHAWTRAITTTNPFTQNRVTQPSELTADVPSIHQREFRTIVRRIDEARSTGQTAGILLTGAAGVGKSHLLARLFTWAHEQGAATVVYLHNVLASPERMPRYLLRALVSTLAGSRADAYPESKLYEIINRAIQAELAQRGGGLPSPKKRLGALHHLGTELDPSVQVFPAVTSFLHHVMRASDGDEKAQEMATSAVEWLSGGVIQNKRAKELHLEEGNEEGSALPDDEAIRLVIDVLAGLCARAGRPFVLCVDQVDNLSAESVAAMAAFLHALVDNCKNLIVITSGVKQSMMAFKQNGVIPDAAWDRLAQYQIDLLKVSPDEAREMVRGRVQKFNRAFEEDPDIAALREREPLLPLTATWLRERFERAPEFRPRDVIGAARDRWETEQDRILSLGDAGWIDAIRRGAEDRIDETPAPPADPQKAIDAYVTKKLEQAKNERILRPEGLPADADNLATLCFELLRHCRGRKEYSLVAIRRSPPKPTPAFLLRATEQAPDGSEVESGMTFWAGESANSATWCLKRLIRQKAPPRHVILVTDEERRPLKLGKKGSEIYQELLQSSGFEHIRLGFADYAMLDAMNVVIGSSRVGDLELDHLGVITEEECLNSMHRQGYFLQQGVLRELLTEVEMPRPSQALIGANEEMIDERIENELRWRLGMSGREMTRIIIEREQLSEQLEATVFEAVKKVAERMHTEGRLFATAEDDDLFLQLGKAKSA